MATYNSNTLHTKHCRRTVVKGILTNFFLYSYTHILSLLVDFFTDNIFTRIYYEAQSSLLIETGTSYPWRASGFFPAVL